MRILFLDSVQDFGGSQKSTLELINNINNEHAILYVDFWGTDKKLLRSLSKNNIKYKILNNRKTPIVIKENKKIIYILKNILKFIINFFKLKKELNIIISSFNPDLVFVNNIKSVSIINKNRNFKVIYFERTWFASQTITTVKRYFLSKIDDFIAVSNATKHAIYSKGVSSLDKIHVLPNAIQIIQPLKKRSQSLTNINILNCGGYIKTKGIHYSLEIAKKLVEKGILFQLDIVGVIYKGRHSKDYYQELVNTIRQNRLEKYVFLHNNIDDMSMFFEKADVLIHPTFSEGLPRVIMEAMANSIPVIANSVGGVNDYILDGYTGFLADFNNIDKFVNRIILLKKNPDIYNFIASNAYALIKTTYSPEIQKKNIDEILLKIL